MREIHNSQLPDKQSVSERASDDNEIFSGLANSTRLQILDILEKKSLRAAKLAQEIGITIQAIQRHIDRLVESGLVIKDVDGNLAISSIGSASLAQMPTFLFLSKYKNYFHDHTFSGIPRPFIQRIGDIAKCEFFEDHMHAWQRAKDHVLNTKKFLYGMTTMQPIEFYIEAKTLLDKGVSFKIIHSEDTTVAKGYAKIREETGWMAAIRDGRVEERYVKHLPLTTVINEDGAEILFASRATDFIDGGSLFYSKDSDFRNWCLDLFCYYWNDVDKVSMPTLKEI